MAALASLFLPVMIMCSLLALKPARAADADPILDYCVANLSNTNLFFNGLPCKPPSSVVSADFMSTAFRGMGNLSNPLGFAMTPAAAGLNMPGLNTQGLILVKFEYAATGGLVPPHIHPRASEVILVQQGAILVGFIDTNGNFFSATLYPGDLFVFPRGLIHFQLGLNSSSNSLSYSSLNSQNPGTSFVASALFASTPGIPNIVLEKSFAITQAEVRAIKKAFGGQ